MQRPWGQRDLAGGQRVGARGEEAVLPITQLQRMAEDLLIWVAFILVLSILTRGSSPGPVTSRGGGDAQLRLLSGIIPRPQAQGGVSQGHIRSREHTAHPGSRLLPLHQIQESSQIPCSHQQCGELAN